MTETKHTPGPWVLEMQEVRPHRIIIRAGDKEILTQDMYAHSSVQRTLADCLAAIGFPASERASIIAALQEQIANACLIAAAPDLLEACQRTLEMLESVEAKMLVGDEGCLWGVEIVRHAIQKAAGPPTSSREP